MSAGTVTCHSCRFQYADTALFCANCGSAKVRDQAADPLLGKVLGERFLVQEKLGDGTSGTIYRAEHVTLRRRVAIKVLHHELSRDDLALERFRREATSVGELDNEHIVEIHDFGRAPDGRLYLAMELLEGETLDLVIARERQLPFEQVADILIQVGEALVEAHAIGFIHRDLRPRNVFLAVRRGKANFVKLFDFGLAKLVEPDAQAASTSLGMTFGDPRYMSPEQARGDRIDRRADIYQLGCVAYEMLTGAPPFVGSRVFDVLTKHVSEAPAPLPSKRPGVPLWLEAAVARMLAKQPDDRFATVTRMVEALRTGLATGVVLEEATARGRETIPPVAATRALEKLGPAPADLTLRDGATPWPSPLTVAGNAAASVSSSMAPTAAGEVAARPARARTGTPRAGVPVSAIAATEPIYDEPAMTGRLPGRGAGRAPTGGGPASSGVVERAPSAPLSDSAAWFADGDRLAAEADDSHDEAYEARRRQRARNLIAPSRHDRSGSSAGLSYEEYLERRNRRIAWIVGGVVGIGLLGAVIVMVSRAVAIPAPAATRPVAVVTPDAARPPPDAAPPPPDAAPVDARRTATTTTPAVVDMGAGPTTPVRPTSTPRPDARPRPPTTPVDPYRAPDARPAASDPSGTAPVDPYAPPPAADAAAPYVTAGDRALRTGDAANAAANYKRALELDGANLAATIGLGEVAAQQGLYADAVRHLKRAAQLAPRSARVQVLLGEAYLNTSDRSSAAAAFRKALSLDPDNLRARAGLDEAGG
ncbi:MAG: serine/threonine-protein kinase [Kofleriaceae bacterium]